MNPVTILLVFIIIWWLVFFMSLPFGVQAQSETKEGVTKGTMPSAPANPHLKKKIIYSTIIALALTVGYYFLATSGLVSFRPPRG